jgi:hypothetical protein
MTTQEFQLKKMGMAIKAMFGLAAIIASFALLIQSTTPAVADAPETTYEAGRYQMSLSSFADQDNDQYYQVIVWDTFTGRSKFYFAAGSTGFRSVSSHQIPSSPL